MTNMKTQRTRSWDLFEGDYINTSNGVFEVEQILRNPDKIYIVAYNPKTNFRYVFSNAFYSVVDKMTYDPTK